MDFEKIKGFIRKGDYIFSDHADEERTQDQLDVEDVEHAIFFGKVIEERLDDPRGESRLIAGKTLSQELIHIIVGFRFDKPLIVTVYKPSPEKWIRGKIRRRKT